MKLLLVSLGILVAATALGTSADAQNYPWCAVYGGGPNGGAQNCGFTTFQQCLDTVRGIGGFCNRNTQYVGGGDSGGSYHRRHKRNWHSDY